MVVAQKRKESLFAFWKKVRFEGGEREIDLWVYTLLNQLSFFLVFLSFLFCFLSYLFSFLLALFFLFTPYNILCFSLYRARQEPFYSACPSVLLSYPLTAFVWSGRTCRPPGLCDIHPCLTEAGLFCSSVYRNISSCHGINAFSLYSQSMHPTVPP